MTDREWITTLLKIFDKAPIKKTAHMDLFFDEDDRAHVRVEFTPEICHAYGDVHGGIFSLAVDTAMWFTLAARYPRIWLATIEIHTYILKPARQRSIEAVGEVIHLGKRSAVAKADVYGDDDKRIAYGSGTFIVLQDLSLSLEEAEEIVEGLYRRYNISP
jgi:uncharacterized protein (TIGR00369 family)